MALLALVVLLALAVLTVLAGGSPATAQGGRTGAGGAVGQKAEPAPAAPSETPEAPDSAAEEAGLLDEAMRPPAALKVTAGTDCNAPIHVQFAARPVPLTPELEDLRGQYLKALCFEAAGQPAQAQALFRQTLQAPQAIPALWRLNLLRLALAQGEPDEATATLTALLELSPSKAYLERVRDLLSARIAGPGAAPPQAQYRYLRAYLAGITPAPEDADLLERLLALARDIGDHAEERAAAVALWRSPQDEKAARHWAGLPRDTQAPGPYTLTGADWYARARRLFELGMYKPLARELESTALPAMPTSTAKALGRLYFRSLIRGRDLQRAAVQIVTDAVLKRFAFDRRQQLIWGVRIHLKQRRAGPALKLVAELEALSPDDPALSDLYYQLADYNRRRRDRVTMRYWCERIVKAFPTSTEASDAYWMMIWDAYRSGDLAAADGYIERAIAASKPFHPVDQARLYYWKGRVQMLQQHRDAGLATWRTLEAQWPYGYYAALAELNSSGEPLTLHNGDTPLHPLPEPPVPKVSALWQVAPFPEALFLFSVGEDAMAADLLNNAVTRPMSPEAVQEAGALFYYLKRHHLQLRLIANHELDVLRRSQVAPSPLWRRAYPRPHWDVVWNEAERAKMDPYFVLAIMREESRFFTGADSTAGAKGLMQLMPSTARAVARRNGLPYDDDRLSHPKTNIPIGTLYLKRLLARFSNDPVYTAAAYNAGPTAVRRWLCRLRSLPLDEFVEQIPYEETQNYVKRVFLSYMVYSKLYR